jgi:hypothetical protein
MTEEQFFYKRNKSEKLKILALEFLNLLEFRNEFSPLKKAIDHFVIKLKLKGLISIYFPGEAVFRQKLFTQGSYWSVDSLQKSFTHHLQSLPDEKKLKALEFFILYGARKIDELEMDYPLFADLDIYSITMGGKSTFNI